VKFTVATLTIACVLLTLPGSAHAKGGGHGGSGGHSGGGHNAGHSSGGHHAASGHASSSGQPASARSASAPHRTSPSTAPKPRHRPGVGQPLTGTAVPRPPLPVTPVGGGLAPLASFPLFGLSGGFGFSSFAGWPIVGTNSWLAADPTGGLRLLIDPESAEVIIDGYYAGVADDFSGRAHPLELAPGSHHVELLAAGYEPLAFDLMIQTHHTIRFAATLRPLAP
jgi:hypothetical protein